MWKRLFLVLLLLDLVLILYLLFFASANTWLREHALEIGIVGSLVTLLAAVIPLLKWVFGAKEKDRNAIKIDAGRDAKVGTHEVSFHLHTENKPGNK